MIRKSGNRFSEKIMLKRAKAKNRFNLKPFRFGRPVARVKATAADKPQMKSAADCGEERKDAAQKMAHRALCRWAITGWLELLLFWGVAFHVHGFGFVAAPRLTSHLASVTPRLTPLVASVAPRLATLVATSAPRLTPFRAGR